MTLLHFPSLMCGLFRQPFYKSTSEFVKVTQEIQNILRPKEKRKHYSPSQSPTVG
jgi:hypothetical protein